MLRTGQGPLRPLWSLAHAILVRMMAEYVRRGQDAAAVYTKGSFAFGEPVYGVSDVDMILVRAGSARDSDRMSQREAQPWKRLFETAPPLGDLFEFWTCYESDVRKAAGATYCTYGLAAGSRDSAAFLGRRPVADAAGILTRPGLYGALRDWRLIVGPDRRPAMKVPSGQDRRLAAWLELQFWWRHVFRGCVEPSGPRKPYLCVKLAAEPARIWLWLVHGEKVWDRREALDRALDVLPEESEALQHALDLYRSLPRSPEAPFAALLPCFVRLSSRIAHEIAAEVAGAGTTDVRLAGRGTEVSLPSGAAARDSSLTSPAGGQLPLVDWRGLALPQLPDETFTLVPGDPGDPETLAAAAVTGSAGPYPALRADGLLILPTAENWRRAVLRGVQCAVTDPVSFALTEGRESARFPNVDGWSAQHSARRAVAEHLAWLELEAGHDPPAPRSWIGTQPFPGPSTAGLGMLFTAARAGLFRDSLEGGEAELLLTVAAVAERLDGAIAREAYEVYRSCLATGDDPPAGTVASFREVVRALPAYA